MVETASEGVLDDDAAQAYPVACPRPLLEHGSAQGGQVVLQRRMGLEDRPEDVGHGEDDAYEGYIGQGGPLLPLPEQGPAIAAARRDGIDGKAVGLKPDGHACNLIGGDHKP